MDGVPACGARSPLTWRSAVAALTLVALVSATVYLAMVLRQGHGEGPLDRRQRAGVRRHRRDVDDVITATAAPTPRVKTETGSPLSEKPGDYFPVYRQVGGGSIDWESEQMSTDGFDVQSKTDYIDDEDYEKESTTSLEKDLADDYDYVDDEEASQETSKFNEADDETGDLEELENISSSSPRGKEFADYYSEFDDGQKFDEDEYETAFIKPGLHYGDNVEIVEQVIAPLISLSSSLPVDRWGQLRSFYRCSLVFIPQRRSIQSSR